MSIVNTPLSSLTSSGLVPLKPHFRIRTPIHPYTLNPTPRSSISGLTVVRRLLFQFKCTAASKANPFDSRFELEDEEEEPFWVSSAKEAIGGLKSLAMFLVEQPGQLKYIEWPSFQSTLKTASLTLVLVALLIVALSSVDSALSFLLALILRKTA